ncbi:hypothetical protein THASP1DRAFT_27778 [Thamnocephalis sphaerospora]|uniref:Uncharacterized protein n=1 Tax=Thamnocephalis sphaerospora TaxID=78915 RepID=A0A4P9XXQ0_9FUNG|nr:hypothetical protein THASP1DRAFT_27778 [Thamnocephalis sphaerospora]|eukprot:RKP10451.1 hypothetical protein THASP1DRAFT_27778 [Thamnocephalis sphaerospora]
MDFPRSRLEFLLCLLPLDNARYLVLHLDSRACARLSSSSREIHRFLCEKLQAWRLLYNHHHLATSAAKELSFLHWCNGIALPPSVAVKNGNDDILAFQVGDKTSKVEGQTDMHSKRSRQDMRSINVCSDDGFDWQVIYRRRMQTEANWRSGLHICKDVVLPGSHLYPWRKRYVGARGVFLVQKHTHEMVFVETLGAGQTRLVQPICPAAVKAGGGISDVSGVRMNGTHLVVRSDHRWYGSVHYLCIWPIGTQEVSAMVAIRPQEAMDELCGNWLLLRQRTQDDETSSTYSAYNVSSGTRCPGELTVSNRLALHIQSARDDHAVVYACHEDAHQISWALHRFDSGGRTCIGTGVLALAYSGLDTTLRSVRIDDQHIFLRIYPPRNEPPLIMVQCLLSRTVQTLGGMSAERVTSSLRMPPRNGDIVVYQTGMSTYLSINDWSIAQRSFMHVKEADCKLVGEYPWPVDQYANQILGTLGWRHASRRRCDCMVVDTMSGTPLCRFGTSLSGNGIVLAMPTYLCHMKKGNRILRILDFGAV